MRALRHLFCCMKRQGKGTHLPQINADERGRKKCRNRLTTARQSRNQKRNIYHGGAETRRNPKERVNSQSQNLNTEDTEKLRRTGEPKIPRKILRGMARRIFLGIFGSPVRRSFSVSSVLRF